MNSVVYEMVRDLHNLMRWLVLMAAVCVLWVDYRGWVMKRSWTVASRRAGLTFMVVLQIQFLVAVALYSLSPLTRSAWSNLRLAMWNREIRFFSIEHPLQMILAVGMATIGTSVSQRAESDVARYRRAAFFYTISILLILTVIPWRFSSHSRPWFPQFRWLGESWW